MIVYDDLENFDRYKDEFHRFKEVTVYQTKYTRKIDYGKKKVILNKGGQNSDVNLLGLINRVKTDAKNYLEKISIDSTKDNFIFWYFYNDMNGIVDSSKNGIEVEVAKMDLKSAYWSKAINDGILSKSTIDYFNGLKFNSVEEKKGARLKALGSWATVKSVSVYNYGKKSSEIIPPILNQQFRALYMGICNSVARDMQIVLSHVNGIYYYWDCIFIDPKYIKEVETLFRDLGYNCTIEKHRASVFKSKYISYFCCPNKKGKMVRYPLY